MWTSETVDEALALLAVGETPRAVSETIGVPRRTIADWRSGKLPGRNALRSRLLGDAPSGRCQAEHDFTLLPRRPYAHLLGMYLGDGYICAQGDRGVFRLRISCDAAYPAVLWECTRSIEAVFPRQRAGLYLRRDCACVEVSLCSKHWPCYIPQHGPGRKHERKIVLADWQEAIVAAEPQAFLRGLIHSDGCRYVARQRSGNRVYEWPRYCFSNRSDDIKRLFCEACDLLGIPWRRADPQHIYINRREGVAILDTFVGPKG